MHEQEYRGGNVAEATPQRVESTLSVEAAVSAAILKIPHATRVPPQQDAQAARLPPQDSLRSRGISTRLTSQARLDITRRVEHQRSAG